jgi:hypothetical protein
VFDVPDALDAVLRRCLAKDPDERPQSAEALGRLFEAIPFERPWTPGQARESWEEVRGEAGRATPRS